MKNFRKIISKYLKKPKITKKKKFPKFYHLRSDMSGTQIERPQPIRLCVILHCAWVQFRKLLVFIWAQTSSRRGKRKREHRLTACLWRTALPRVGVFDRMALMRHAPKAFTDRAPPGATIINRASTHSIPSENKNYSQRRPVRQPRRDDFLSNVGHLFRETVWTTNRWRVSAALPPDRLPSTDTGSRRSLARIIASQYLKECCPSAFLAARRLAHRRSIETKLPGWSCQ